MKKGRRKKIRFIQKMPKILQFSPRGKPGRPDEIELKVDQYEAIKLADYQGYNQAEGAMAMGISRPSFGRILREARRVVADALVCGKIIRIRVSDVQVGVHKRQFPLKQKDSPNNEIALEMQAREELIRKKIVKYSRNKASRTD